MPRDERPYEEPDEDGEGDEAEVVVGARDADSIVDRARRLATAARHLAEDAADALAEDEDDGDEGDE